MATPAMVFLSYSTVNAHAAGDIKRDLEEHSYSCFLAHDDIAAASDWQAEIWTALKGARAFVGLVTPEYNQSHFCQQEVGAAYALGLPSLLILSGAELPPGFAARFQAINKVDKLIPALDTVPEFRGLRVEAWIERTRDGNSFEEVNAAYKRFSDEWNGMTDGDKLRWLLAGNGNGQVQRESYNVGPFFKRALHELKPLLIPEWLKANDLDGSLQRRLKDL